MKSYERKTRLRKKALTFNKIKDHHEKMIFMKKILAEINFGYGRTLIYRPDLGGYICFAIDGVFYFKFIYDEMGELKDFHIEEK